MNDSVIYNVKTIIKSNVLNEEELKGIFNSKLLKIIISLESDSGTRNFKI